MFSILVTFNEWNLIEKKFGPRWMKWNVLIRLVCHTVGDINKVTDCDSGAWLKLNKRMKQKKTGWNTNTNRYEFKSFDDTHSQTHTQTHHSMKIFWDKLSSSRLIFDDILEPIKLKRDLKKTKSESKQRSRVGDKLKQKKILFRREIQL